MWTLWGITSVVLGALLWNFGASFPELTLESALVIFFGGAFIGHGAVVLFVQLLDL